MGEMDTYAAHVVSYLESDHGRDTPPLIAARLLALGPGQMGMATCPTLAQLHNTRQALEEIEPEAAPEDRHDDTGVWVRPHLAIRSA